jgi:flavodoxin
MNIRVKYHSTTGNTKKVAEAISETAGVQAEQILENSTVEAVDLLFIGDGIYAGKTNINTVNFIKTLNSDKVKNAAVFGTYGGQEKAIVGMKELLKAQGINVMEESFGCRGKAWFFLNRKHPDSQELANAKKFADNILNKLK